MPDTPTFEQLLAWILDTSEEDEETFAEWLARQPKDGEST
jgi:hypothetical protein